VDETELLNLKRSLAPGLLALPGVSGVGIGDGTLRIYLAQDDAGVKEQVRKIVSASNKEVPIEFIASGEFRAQNN
jgi:hypothetical protein